VRHATTRGLSLTLFPSSKPKKPKKKKQVVGLGDPAAPDAALVHAPLAVEPSPLPRAAFEAAVSAAPDFNALAAAVAADADWLEATLAPAAAAGDAFTARLLSLRRGTARTAATDLALAVTRSDYMVDGGSGGGSGGALLQVELNTIASSFGCLGTAASALHASAAARAGWPAEAIARLPPNSARASIAAALAAGAAASGVGSEEGIVLFVVQPGERNAYDQAALAEELWTAHGWRVVRATLEEVAEHGVLGGPEDGWAVEDPAAPPEGRPARPLAYRGRPVALAYLRAGYAPGDYPSDAAWAGRALLERSTAAVCPTAAWQLAGSKKVQQALAAPGVTEQFVGTGEAAERVRAHYAGLWSLDPADHGDGNPASGRAALATLLRDAAARPHAFVLKPQREGGGNNTYGAALAAAATKAAADLEAGGDGGLGAFILMQRIQPAPHASTLVRAGVATPAPVDCVAELGVFGAWLGRRGQAARPLLNTAAGHLVRTKPAGADEGGVAAGYAVLSSPYLVG
jgi:glutathione synthase